MLLYNCSDRNLTLALDAANDKYRENLALRVAGQRGTATSFRLVVRNSHDAGAKYARGRHVAAACWHAHRDFMVALFDLAPQARLKTAVAYYKGRDDFNAKFEATGNKNVGSMMEPLLYRDACNCDGGTTFGTLMPNGVLKNVRVLPRRALLSCPHVILVADHYRANGECRCDDPTHTEMKEWGYVWKANRWQADPAHA